jgi:selenocysteine-specific elongation factor
MRNKLFSRSPECLVEDVLERMNRTGVLELKGGLVRLSSHEISLDTGDQKIRDNLISRFNETQLSPPALSLLRSEMGIDETKLKEILTILKDEGQLISITREIILSKDTIENAQRKISDYLETKGKATASELRTMLGGSRKFIIPLLEYFDRQGFTRREGDHRVLR